ncbi:unnamed protein product, partial [Ixodes hexagonus]
FSNSKSLQKVSLEGVPGHCVRRACESLDKDSPLESLSLFDLTPSEPEGPFRIKFSEAFRYLKVLNITCTALDDACALDLATLIETSETLRELDASSSSIKDCGGIVIANSLRTNKALVKLILSGNDLTSSSLVAFAEAMTINTTLEFLDISDVEISAEDSKRLFDPKHDSVFRRTYITWNQNWLNELTAILKRDNHMPQLHVDINSEFSPTDLTAFFDALLSNRTVTELSFHPSGDMFDVFVDRLASLLEQTETIRNVYNHLGLGGSVPLSVEESYLTRLLNALKKNKSVEEFATYVSVITLPLAVTIGELLEANDTLTDLALCEYYSLDADVAQAIANGLRYNCTLLELRLHWEADVVEGMSDIWEALRRNKALLCPVARFVTGRTADESAARALKKAHRSRALVQELMKLTGKDEAGVREDIAAALCRAEHLSA